MTKAKLNTSSFRKLPLASHIQYMRACASVNKQISECVVSIINKQVSGYVGDIYTYIIHQHMNQHVSVFTRIPCPPPPSPDGFPLGSTKNKCANKLSKSPAKSTSEYPADTLFGILSARSTSLHLFRALERDRRRECVGVGRQALALNNELQLAQLQQIVTSI